MFKLMESKVDSFFRYRLLEKVFWCLRTNISLKQSYDVRRNNHCPLYLKCFSDMEQMSKRFFALKRRSLSHVIVKYQYKSQSLLKRNAKKTLNFRGFILAFEKEIQTRTLAEQKLLLTAFEARGLLRHRDIAVISNIAKISGEKFSDPKPLSSIQEYSSVHTGYNISKVRVALQTGLGIVGWQTFWSADCCLPTESPPRGKLAGTGITTHDFFLKPHDFLVEVEYIGEGAVMIGIRFCTFYNGWSKWIGNKGNTLSKRYRLSASMAEFSIKDNPYKPGGPKEVRHPGLPWDYIIGFGGLESSVRATCLSIIVRKVQSQNVFSYHWVDDAVEVTKRKIAHKNNQGNSDDSSVLPVIGTIQRPMSASQKRNADLLQHLTDLQCDAASEVSEIIADGNNLRPCEEQLFDIIRMRAVELKAAERRALVFARRLWSSVKLRQDPTISVICNIGVLIGLTRWFMEALGKSLVETPDDPATVSQLYTEIHYANVEAEILQNRINSSIGSLEATEASEATKPWYGKALLGPQLRSQKKAFSDGIRDMKEALAEMQRKQIRVANNIVRLHEEADRKLPRFQLSLTVCNNMRLKMAAARYKSNLLEKMSLESLKEHLGGKAASEGEFEMSESDHERLRESKNLRNQPVHTQVDLLLQNTTDHLEEISLTRQTIRGARNHVADNGRPSSGEDFVHQAQRKTYRKTIAVNPKWSQSPGQARLKPNTISLLKIRLPTGAPPPSRFNHTS
jgi:hypothetical protein